VAAGKGMKWAWWMSKVKAEIVSNFAPIEPTFVADFRSDYN
jgi:hypothetical protein